MNEPSSHHAVSKTLVMKSHTLQDSTSTKRPDEGNSQRRKMGGLLGLEEGGLGVTARGLHLELTDIFFS